LEVITDSVNPGSNRSGEVVSSRDWPISMTKIDAGKDSPFSFYIYNQSPHYVRVFFPQSATFLRAGEEARQETRFLPPRLQGIMLPPPLPIAPLSVS
jgi:hypothetical protein